MGPGPAGFKEKIGWQGTAENLGTQRKIFKKIWNSAKKKNITNKKIKKNCENFCTQQPKGKLQQRPFSEINCLIANKILKL